ncbi:MAG: PTS lactose/cellobiose transporter subunit IIA [Aerococcus sp.]|nr:PTS lactose/cellobiose transporter subunit IIA [Aerococcus sp.]
MSLIIYGGDGKSSSMEAIQAAKDGDFDLANQKIKAAEDSLLEAHHKQSKMLAEEAQGNSEAVSLLMVHAQDHLMTGVAFKDLAKEIVELYKKLDDKE